MKTIEIFFLGVAVSVLLLGFVLAIPDFSTFGTTSSFNEDAFPVFTYNFTSNITTNGSDPADNTIVFSILEINSSQYPANNSPSFYYWITLDSSTGVMFLNSTRDNETGQFNLSVQVLNGDSLGESRPFYFVVNATNDAPNLTSVIGAYNFTQAQNSIHYLNATDEEEHYPLIFNISFNGSCTHASWTGRIVNENCTLFDFNFSLTNSSNLSAFMNFTAAKNDVGTYWANITVMDYGNSTAYGCPHKFCDNATYNLNKTTSYSTIVQFNVFATLEINTSDCDNKIFLENINDKCQINITSKGTSDSMNISTLAILRNYNGGVSNVSWFYANNSISTTNFVYSVDINVTPNKTEIGNWTINFTVMDVTEAQNLTVQVNVYVNRTTNSAINLETIPNYNTSQDLETVINLTVYDDDLFIPDKDTTGGGYNETTTFVIQIFNQSDLTQTLTLSDFSITPLNAPVLNGDIPTNRTFAEIRFTPVAADVGIYTINITVNDSDNSRDFQFFNLSINSNSFPFWNQTNYTLTLDVNSTFPTTQLFTSINFTRDGYANDSIGDILSFVNGSGAFPRFNLSSEGTVVFTPWKADVGYWSFTVTATDQLGLQNTTSFFFNISNINSPPIIEAPISPTGNNATGNSVMGINVSEDNYTTITLWLQDDDFRVIASQRAYYSENLTVNITIEGANPNLFNFTLDSDFAPNPSYTENRSKFDAIFTPNKTDAGPYNITINVSDIGNSSFQIKFNLTVFETAHNPVLVALINQSTGINRTLFYDINTTDVEDINDSWGNLTYNYTFVTGLDFINFDQDIFNTTSGILNLTFNDSHEGSYEINITVNDSAGTMNSGIFWVYVYGVPNITVPNTTMVFTLQENVTLNISFSANHSVGDNLTYVFYVNGALRNSNQTYGNNTPFNWSFTPNFTDETYGLYQNLTLVVYPNSSQLVNASDFNTTQRWNINVTHSNAPIRFSGNIGDKGPVSYASNIDITLLTFFSDVDYLDAFYNQSLTFSVASNKSPSSISTSVSSDLVLTLSANIATQELLNITGTDASMNATSNNFVVRFTTPVTVTGAGSGSSGTTIVTKPVSLKIILPDPVSVLKGETIQLPITLQNNGEFFLSGITLSGTVAKDGILRDDLLLVFDRTSFDSLAIGDEEHVTLTIHIATEVLGTYEITLLAEVVSPDYTDSGKIFITVEEGERVQEKLVFTEEFLADNPECFELLELVEEAKALVEQGRPDLAREKTDEAINACKEAISQPGRPRERLVFGSKLYTNLLLAMIFAFFTGISYYSYRRIKLKRSAKRDKLAKNEKIIKIRESI